jgi:uncharacterized protein (TIGR02145 family)
MAGKKLKAQSGWNNCGPAGSGNSYVCEDTFGFSALPGGHLNTHGDFYDAGSNGQWRSASEGSNASRAYIRGIDNSTDDIDYAGWLNDDKAYGISVRCLKD